MTNEEILNKINGGLIVSCHALESEPLYDSYIMSKMAWAAKLGGAVGIRANTVVDIKAIKEKVDLPIIGIIKQEYDDSDVYITPTMAEVDALVEVGCEIIAIDATNRLRPNGITLESFFKEVRKKYPNQLFMADTSAFLSCSGTQIPPPAIKGGVSSFLNLSIKIKTGREAPLVYGG